MGNSIYESSNNFNDSIMNTYFALKALDGLTKSNTVTQITTSEWVMFGCVIALSCIIFHFTDKKYGNISKK